MDLGKDCVRVWDIFWLCYSFFFFIYDSLCKVFARSSANTSINYYFYIFRNNVLIKLELQAKKLDIFIEILLNRTDKSM